MNTALLVALLAGGVLCVSGMRRIPPSHRGVVVRLGKKLERVAAPGWKFLVPGVDRLLLVSVEPFRMSLPPQSAITRDEIPLQVQSFQFDGGSQPGKHLLPQLGRLVVRGKRGNAEKKEGQEQAVFEDGILSRVHPVRRLRLKLHRRSYHFLRRAGKNARCCLLRSGTEPRA